MIKVIGIQFNSSLKTYDFKPGRHKTNINDYVVVETVQGIEIGRVIYIDKEISAKEMEEPHKEIMRIADEKDIKRWEKMRQDGLELVGLFREKVAELKLDMKPITVEYSFDGERIIFYFTAENRVDFRELIKVLSRAVNKQVVMRQIGPRDEAKLLGGYGICGQPVCCVRFLTQAESVSMDMAREQYEMNVNANKVTGLCGRLMCCLAFEEPEKKKGKTK
ncbi:MAG: regulatory iron-sulfur-containing complex subunit RicT [Patescibacteria group bacterium]|nr:regulatory iron-sulfur-containing complex subunit RicT [Patescibacteria group bacterium]